MKVLGQSRWVVQGSLTTPRSGEFAQEVGMSPQHESVNQGGLPGLTAEVGVGDHLADWPEGCGAL